MCQMVMNLIYYILNLLEFKFNYVKLVKLSISDDNELNSYHNINCCKS
jgi:hypothetical protein